MKDLSVYITVVFSRFLKHHVPLLLKNPKLPMAERKGMLPKLKHLSGMRGGKNKNNSVGST